MVQQWLRVSVCIVSQNSISVQTMLNTEIKANTENTDKLAANLSEIKAKMNFFSLKTTPNSKMW